MADSGSDNLSPNSALYWFSSDVPGSEGPSGWRLDVVTLLAVIGESSIAEHAQTITASILCLLPRIIPAPQALLKPSRPARLPEVTAKMTGVYSGVVLDTVGFFANIIHPLDQIQPYSFKILEIKHRDRNEAGGAKLPAPAPAPTANGSNILSKFLRPGRADSGLSSSRSIRRAPDNAAREEPELTGVAFSSSADVEAGQAHAPAQGITRRESRKDKVQDYVTNPTLVNSEKRPAIPATLFSPIHILEIFSVILTFSIIGFAAHYKDGTAIVAVSLISLASSVVGWASLWSPILMKRSHTNKVPKGDVIIRTREGGFLLIRCTEEVARELYSGTEECKYVVSGRSYRVLMGIGTFLLMVAVILLGNCKWKTQIFIGASYITLNGMYWAMGLLPKSYFWDLSRYDFKDVTPPEAKHAEEKTDPSDPREGWPSFTRTLWFAIRATQKTAWVQRSGAAPNTPQWNLWLREAEAAAEAAAKAAENGKTKPWPSVARKDVIMKMSDEEIENLNKRAKNLRPVEDDGAKQAVPAVEIQHVDRPGPNTGF
ncbi:hypothetical protein F4775DRAFT_585978 [Biscogniauxia sp. FL1348]|nr:hypothetical protein F4775DRAFT_585978 [Biscogniauxia sp. FL1348]